MPGPEDLQPDAWPPHAQGTAQRSSPGDFTEQKSQGPETACDLPKVTRQAHGGTGPASPLDQPLSRESTEGSPSPPGAQASLPDPQFSTSGSPALTAREAQES